MPRYARCAPAGFAYHILNRAVARVTLFEKAYDYRAFEGVLQEAHSRVPLPILAFCVMPNHWHFVVQPQTDTQVTDFFRWLTHTHAMRWHAHHDSTGTGHLYQGRFKSFPIEENEHLYTVLRYVERNARRANLVEHSSQWRWGSCWHRQQEQSALRELLAEWPIPRPENWNTWVDEPQTEAELAAIQQSASRGTPYGSEQWIAQTAANLRLESTLRPRGRPRKHLT